MEPFQTAAQRKVLAELGVLALQVLDALLGLRDGLDRRGVAVGDLVGQPLDLALERKRLADERDRLAGGMAQAESPELEPEDGHRRGPRR